MNGIVNKFSLAGDKFMYKMHLRQCSWPFTKKERSQKFKERWNWLYVYQNEQDKACFLAYWDPKDLTRRTASDKILHYKASNIAKNPKYARYQRSLASMIYKCFDQKSAFLADEYASGGAIKKENVSNKELTEELHKPIIKKFKERKVQSPFVDNIWGADLANMQLISKFN